MGLIVRRGPTKWTQIISWNTRSDTFQAGQCFRGAFYDRRCDLSPSGDKWIYFVAKHHLHSADPSYTSTWTAIATPPYLTALALWPNGGTTYCGGGLFESENAVSVNALGNRWSKGLPVAHPKHEPPSRVKVTPISFAWADQLFPKRMVRDGWTLVTPGDLDADMSVSASRGRLLRTHKNRRLQLDFDYQKTEYTLLDEDPDTVAGADWADWDQQGRLVFARDGALFRERAEIAGGKRDVDVIASFDDNKPSRIKAPPTACRW